MFDSACIFRYVPASTWSSRTKRLLEADRFRDRIRDHDLRVRDIPVIKLVPDGAKTFGAAGAQKTRNAHVISARTHNDGGPES
jgi:hypothetical protein